ncbi:MAG TPA: hypothetical protein VLA05_05800 [Coriobacteriia bacterium]|nr:hypothetical protein [Coriobacteriia bacterium]
MAKKQAQKQRQFDWMTYSKPARILTDAQEESLSAGLLQPLLSAIIADPSMRLDIRARSANLYYRGSSLLRLTGEPMVAEFEPAGGGALERVSLTTPSDVEALLGRTVDARDAVDRHLTAGEAPARRAVLLAVADANGGGDLFASEYVVVDLEYTYGKRRYDLIAIKRTEGVTGPGGFSNPRLAFVDVRCREQGLGGANSLEAVGGDLADFTKAVGGSHLERAKLELAELIAQKVRLGLLPQELDMRALDHGLPELLVAFVGYEKLVERDSDSAIIALHERLSSRHFPTEHRLRFVDLPPAVADKAKGPDAELMIRCDDLMTYRQLKEYRLRGRQ